MRKLRKLTKCGLMVFQAGRRPSTVPIHRSSGLGEKQPMVYPSAFNTPDIQAVQPIEDLIYNRNSGPNGPFHYGPRSLKLEESKEASDSDQLLQRRRRSDEGTELGVQSAYEVVSEVDLDFTPDLEEERKRIAVFQVSLPSLNFFCKITKNF